MVLLLIDIKLDKMIQSLTIQLNLYTTINQNMNFHYHSFDSKKKKKFKYFCYLQLDIAKVLVAKLQYQY